jgi:hypothetical protein
MTTKPAAIRLLLTLAAATLGALRRFYKRLTTPGSGPFLASS